jgi:hypothetical protein
VLVEAFVPQASVEALNEAILHRFARRDVMSFDDVLLLQLGWRLRSLGAVVADQRTGIASQFAT